MKNVEIFYENELFTPFTSIHKICITSQLLWNNLITAVIHYGATKVSAEVTRTCSGAPWGVNKESRQHYRSNVIKQNVQISW